MIAENTKKIETRAFAHQDTLEEICIPDSVTEIGERAFIGCTALKKVVLSPNLRRIAVNAFEGCTALSEIVFHEGLNIGWYAFKGCTALKSIKIPEHCTVGTMAFWHCENLTCIKLPHKAEICWTAFADCPAIETVYAPTDADYHQLFKRLPATCRILDLEGNAAPHLRMKITQWDDALPAEALPHAEKLQGLPLEQQLQRCFVVETTTTEKSSYGETDSKVTRESRVHMTTAYDFDTLLVKEGIAVGFVDLQGKAWFLGQILTSYSSSDSDGTGRTDSDSITRLIVLDA